MVNSKWKGLTLSISGKSISKNFYLPFTIYNLLDVSDLFNGCDDLFDIWYRRVLEILRVGHWHIGAGNAFNWSVEIIKSKLHDFRGDLCCHAAERMRLFGNYHAIGFLYRVDNSL